VGEGVRRCHHRLFAGAAYLQLRSARGMLSDGKRRGTCRRPYLGIVGRGEVVAHSRNGELLFLKPGDGIGNTPVVLRL
jgi:hypothetical protein